MRSKKMWLPRLNKLLRLSHKKMKPKKLSLNLAIKKRRRRRTSSSSAAIDFLSSSHKQGENVCWCWDRKLFSTATLDWDEYVRAAYSESDQGLALLSLFSWYSDSSCVAAACGCSCFKFRVFAVLVWCLACVCVIERLRSRVCLCWRTFFGLQDEARVEKLQQYVQG